MERATGIEPVLPAWESEFSILYFQYLQNRSEKMYVHALHTVHALPDPYRCGTFAGRCVTSNLVSNYYPADIFKAVSTTGFAQSGIAASSHTLANRPRPRCTSNLGDRLAVLRGSASLLLSYTRSSVSFGMSRIKFKRLRMYRSRILSSGM